MSAFVQIIQEIGDFGVFQRCLSLVLCLTAIFISFDLIGQVFTGVNFPHHCNTDWILALGHNLSLEKQRNLTIPVDEDGQFESCVMFTPVDFDLEIIEAYGINSTTSCSDGWVYETSHGASSIVTEFNVVCDRGSLIVASQSINMAGYFVGVLLCGCLADRFGRRRVLLLSLSLLLLSGVSSAFSPNIYFYMAMKFAAGFAVGGTSINTYVIAGEWSSSSKFAVCTLMFVSSFPIGLILLSGIAYFIRNWRFLQLVLASPLALLLGVLYWIVPESARWLMIKGKTKDLKREIARAARINGTKVSEDLLDMLDNHTPSREGNLLDLLRLSYLRRRALILGYVWFGTSMVYYGLSLNVAGFGMDIYLTQLIFGLAELPAHLLTFLLIQRLGRRVSQAGFLFVAGSACILATVVPIDLPEVTTAVAALGKFAATASFSCVYVYTSELYPTTLRQSGVGLNSSCARVAGILAPLITFLHHYHRSLPMLTYGLFPVSAAALCSMLPETLNAELEDYVELKKPSHGGHDPQRETPKSTRL